MTDPAHPPILKLTLAADDDILQAIRYGMTYENGKSRPRHAIEVAVDVLAQMVLRHLQMSGFVIMRQPPLSGHTTSSRPGGYKDHLTE